MNCLVFYKAENRKGRNDAKGAFIPEAEAFQRLHGIPARRMIPIPHIRTKGARRLLVLEQLLNVRRQLEQLDAVVYFGHGTTRSLPCIGFGMGHVQVLADHLLPVLRGNGKIVLYACLAGKGKVGIADAIDNALPEPIKTISHLTAGHTSWNPNAEYSGEGPEQSGVPIIAKGDPLWLEWLRRLREDQQFRLAFPFLSPAEIRFALGEGDHVPPGPSRLIPERP